MKKLYLVSWAINTILNYSFIKSLFFYFYPSTIWYLAISVWQIKSQSLQTGCPVKLQLRNLVLLVTAWHMSIMIMIGAHRGLKAASKVMELVDSTSIKVLEETQLAMTKFFAGSIIQDILDACLTIAGGQIRHAN